MTKINRILSLNLDREWGADQRRKNTRFKLAHEQGAGQLGGVSNAKKTADGGFDGYMTFNVGDTKELVLIEAKSGNVNVKNLREFIQVVKSRKGAIGAFVCFEEQITKPMLLEAKKEGYYDEERWGQKFDRIQVISVESLLEGEGVNIPESTVTTFKTAKFKYKKSDNQISLLAAEPSPDE